MAALLKNLYNDTYINRLSLAIKSSYPNFDTVTFTASVFNDSWEQKELKKRMRHISSTLGLYLTDDYQSNVKILQETFLQMNYNYGLENMIFQDFVEVYGMDDFDTSMVALESFTVNCSSEFAIRRFIIKYPIQTMRQMKLWTKSNNEHIRRLASEGCRPRLPWAIALPPFKENPTEVLEILELLKDDESEYVRKSVANNINDISKDNPEIVMVLTKSWIAQNKIATLY